MVDLQIVERHSEVKSGDILAYVEQDNDTTVYKAQDNTVGTLLHLVQIHLLDIPKTTIKVARYDSPLKQVVIKKITIEK